jgi:hypothetical protein
MRIGDRGSFRAGLGDSLGLGMAQAVFSKKPGDIKNIAELKKAQLECFLTDKYAKSFGLNVRRL